ncbi:MAG: PP2C family protein-serine/threonine phosphatase [Phycisphaerales bacterium JB041]
MPTTRPDQPRTAGSPASAGPSDAHALQCMQVWGDNRAADSSVVMPGLDAWVHSRPAGTADAGGDVHYVSSCATGRIVRLLVADVSGHGDSVAEVAGKLRALMRRHMNQADQRKLLKQINREFLGLSRLGQFATAVVISCWTPTGALTVSIAGHPSPLRFRADTGAWEPLFAAGEHANLPLGVDDDTDFQQVRVRLEPEEMLLAFSDGLIESRDAGGGMLGQRGLIEMLNEIGAPRGQVRLSPDGQDSVGAPDRLVQSLIERVEARRGGEPIEDDTTAMLIRPNELRPKASLLGGIGAGFRLARGVLGSAARPAEAPVPQVNAINLLGAFSDRFNRP